MYDTNVDNIVQLFWKSSGVEKNSELDIEFQGQPSYFNSAGICDKQSMIQLLTNHQSDNTAIYIIFNR